MRSDKKQERLSDGAGLWLRVTSNQTKQFRFDYIRPNSKSEDFPKGNVVSEHDENSQSQEVIGKISKLEPEMEKKESFLNQVHMQSLSGIARKDAYVNKALKAKNLAAENKVQQKDRPSFEELKNDLKSLSQLIHSAPRRVKTSAVKGTQN